MSHMNVVVASPSDPTTTSITSTTTSLTGVSITALLPSVTSSSTTPTLAPVIIVPPPVPPVVFHLGSSSSLVTAQIVNSALAASEEQPTSLTLFGQSLETELQKPFKPRLGPRSETHGLIDVVEPFQPLDPAATPKADPAIGPGAFGDWPSRSPLSPSAIDAVLEASNGGLVAVDRGRSCGMLAAGDVGARRACGDSRRASSSERPSSWPRAGITWQCVNPSRFKIRWLPGRAGSNLPPGRWPAFRRR